MPSPLLHVAAGASVCLLDRRAFSLARWFFVVAVMAASLLPDFDVIPGLVIGDPNRFHSDISHSLGFGLIAALCSAMLVKRARWRTAFWVFVAAGLHCVLDSMTADGRPPYGVPLFWPLDSDSYQISNDVFSGFRHGNDGAAVSEFFGEVFSWANVQTILKEGAIGVVMVTTCLWLGRKLEMRRADVG